MPLVKCAACHTNNYIKDLLLEELSHCQNCGQKLDYPRPVLGWLTLLLPPLVFTPLFLVLFFGARFSTEVRHLLPLFGFVELFCFLWSGKVAWQVADWHYGRKLEAFQSGNSSRPSRRAFVALRWLLFAGGFATHFLLSILVLGVLDWILSLFGVDLKLMLQ